MRMSIMENLKPEKFFELELPDGTKMRAVTSENITYPAINIEIFHNGSWEKICCAEYDSDRAEGKKLCIGAFPTIVISRCITTPIFWSRSIKYHMNLQRR